MAPSSPSILMRHLTLMLLCWPAAAAFAAPFGQIRTSSSRRVVPLPSMNDAATNLHLKIPRGGGGCSCGASHDNDSELSSGSSSSSAAALPLASIISSAGGAYSAALVARPVMTKSLTAGLTFFLSDYCAQRIESPRSSSSSSSSPSDEKDNENTHNWTRTLVSCAVGLFYFGPAAHAWYEWIFKVLPGTTLISTLQKAALGQIIFGPSFTCVFFATSLMQSGSFTLGNWFKKIKNDLPQAFISGAGFWPLVDLVSYSLIPIKFIPLFINMCSFVWTIYLSVIANKK